MPSSRCAQPAGARRGQSACQIRVIFQSRFKRERDARFGGSAPVLETALSIVRPSIQIRHLSILPRRILESSERARAPLAEGTRAEASVELPVHGSL